jgi:NAD(P)-dependent dehydrogenase (short-subunit alcohol dehydrogenase family)
MKTYLLVGASSAMAQATTAQLEQEGNRVIRLSRNASFSDVPMVDYLGALPAIEGSLDGIVYFPGTIQLKPFRSLSLEDFQQDLNIHVLGAIHVLKSYATLLNPSSSVVLISSVAARVGMPYHASVSLSKGALEGLALALAAEWSPKTRVNVVAPSLTQTPMADKLTNTLEKREAGANRHPLKRLGTPEDFSQIIAFLLSEKSAWITGQTFAVDGGLAALKA